MTSLSKLIGRIVAFFLGISVVHVYACDDTVLQQRTTEAWNAFFEERLQACRPAFKALGRAHSHISKDYASIEPHEITDLAAVYNTYELSCFESLEDIRCKTRRFINDVLGGLFLPAGEYPNVPFCTVTRIDDRHVLTARHCLYIDKKRTNERIFYVSLMSMPEKRFPVIGERFLEYMVDENTAVDTYPFSDYEDIAVLEVDFDAVPTMNKRVIGPNLKMKDNTLVPGTFVPALFLEDDLSLSSWAEKVRLDYSQNCQWLHETANANSSSNSPFFSSRRSKKRCIPLECQTFRGMSGAPIIGYSEDDGFFVGGVFIRSGSANSELVRATCKNTHLVGYNLGITIPQSLIEALVR
jgi:hypothetical protein